MDPEELEQVIDDLYALTPEEFVPRRSELAKAAKADGDKAAAATITGLRRPTVGAWLVNTLVRHHGDQVEALFDLAASLRAAQDELDGDQLRQLTTQRGQLVAAMARQARALAHELGRTVSSGVVEEVEQTLRAALADPVAAAEVRAGRLTTGLTYSGLGGFGGLGTGEGAVPIGASGASGASGGQRPARQPAPSGIRPAPGRPPAAADRPTLRAVPSGRSPGRAGWHADDPGAGSGDGSGLDGQTEGGLIEGGLIEGGLIEGGGAVVALVTRAERQRAERAREAARQARERDRSAARLAWHRAQDDEARLRRGHEATQAAARAAVTRSEQAQRRVQQVEADLVAARQEQQDAEAAAAVQQQDVAAAAEALAQAGAAVAELADRVRLLDEDPEPDDDAPQE